MQIIVLGSSAEAALPRMKNGRILETPIELSRDDKDRRTRASIAVKLPHDDGYIVIDATPDFWLQVYRAGIQDKIKAVLITSSKPHHAQGLYQHHLPVLTFAGRQTWNDLTEAKVPSHFRRIIDRPMIPLHGLQIFPFDVSHTVIDSNEEQRTARTFGVRIFDESSKQTLVYIPDLMKIPTRSRRLAENADLMLLDGSTYERTYNEHRPMRQWLSYLNQGNLNPLNLWFTGVGYDALPHKQLRQKVRESFENSDICYDGLVIKLENSRVKINES